MYHIIGIDGRQYGPIPAETLQQWITQGRVNADTQVRLEGTAQWQPLGSLPEFYEQVGEPSPTPEALAQTREAGRDKARALANPAGWALMIAGIVGALVAMGQIVFYAVKGIPNNPLMDRFMSHGGSAAEQIGAKFGFYGALLMSIVWAGVVALAGVKLRRLESWGWVLAGTILAIIPCCGSQFPACAVTTPIGIWALIVICQSKVKSEFR